MTRFLNQKGNTMLFTLGMLSIMMVMFIFVVNLTKVLAVKEQSNTTAQQASLAVTSILYESLWEKFKDYKEIPVLPETPGLPVNKSIEEKVEEREMDLRTNSSYAHFSEKELHIEAIDQILVEELQKPTGKKLKEQMELEMSYQILPEMKDVARETILDNNGNLEESQLFIKNNRIEIKASQTVKATTFGEFFKGLEDRLFQQSAGPKISFLSELSGWSDRTEELD
ncbi:MAG TPA: Tad domain-containing protein [Pseudoneobacillus sp.]|jgi:hypothetical protein|nr:Tad domain-containing protein [Pseudoneobacillus sp.]